jgi:hypothetical protein
MSSAEVQAKIGDRGSKVETYTSPLGLPRYSGTLTALPNSEALAVEVFTLKPRAGAVAPSQDKLTVFYGPERGSEKALVIERENFFAEGGRPALADTLAQLEQQFGVPSARHTDSVGMVTLYWSWDGSGALRRGIDARKMVYCSKDFMRTPVSSSPRANREVGNLVDVCGDVSLKVSLPLSIDKAFLRSTFTQLVAHKQMYAMQDRINVQVNAFMAKARAQESAVSKSSKTDF